jgi:hypothetical protein
VAQQIAMGVGVVGFAVAVAGATASLDNTYPEVVAVTGVGLGIGLAGVGAAGLVDLLRKEETAQISVGPTTASIRLRF